MLPISGGPKRCCVELDRQTIERSRSILLEGIARGERAIEDGRTFTHAEAKQRLSRWLR